MTPRTRVYLTVDVECAEARGVQPPLGYDLRVWGRFENQTAELGITAIMREIERYGARGTFFVEALGAVYFGIEGLRDVCSAIGARGHDIQLHTHPIQAAADAVSRGASPVADDIGAYPRRAQTALLETGLARLVEAGVPKDGLRAFRAGNFGATNETWQAMADTGLVLSSNYNPCYFGKNCKMRFEAAAPGLFAAPAPGVFELPITCFEEATLGTVARYRHLQIAAVSTGELVSTLRTCHALGIREVTIVTHSFELYVIDDVAARRAHVNRVNLERLREVMAFLHDARDSFEVDTVGALAARLKEGAEAPPTRSYAYPRGTLLARVGRMGAQAWKRADTAVARARARAS